MREELIAIILNIATEQNPTLPRVIEVERLGEAPLYGRGGPLDSLGLVRFIVEIEAAVEGRFGRPIVLADERAMSQQRSPFRTVGALAEYVANILNEPEVGKATP